MSMASTVKIFRVLERLCLHGPVKASVLSSELDLNKSSVHRFLNVLADMGYVAQQEETGLYAATLKIHEMGVQVKNRIGIARIAAPFMHRLQAQLKEGINLGVLTENEMATLERVLPDGNKTNIIVKARLPAYCTAIGKMLLASLSEDSFEEYLSQVTLQSYTARTVKTADQLRVMIAGIKQDGFSVDNRELDDNLISIASPIRDENGIVIAAMSVTGTVSQMVDEHFAQVKTELRAVTADISRTLGYRPE